MAQMRILVIDVGGTHVKVLATGHKQRIEIPSAPKMTPAKMVSAVRAATVGWKYRSACAWETIPTSSKAAIAFGPSLTAPQLISGSSIKS
jgi:hypothetical protein